MGTVGGGKKEMTWMRVICSPVSYALKSNVQSSPINLLPSSANERLHCQSIRNLKSVNVIKQNNISPSSSLVTE